MSISDSPYIYLFAGALGLLKLHISSENKIPHL